MNTTIAYNLTTMFLNKIANINMLYKQHNVQQFSIMHYVEDDCIQHIFDYNKIDYHKDISIFDFVKLITYISIASIKHTITKHFYKKNIICNISRKKLNKYNYNIQNCEIHLENAVDNYSRFSMCLNLTKVVFYGDYLPEHFFRNCINLKYAELHNVKKIDFNAFKNCISLQKINIYGTNDLLIKENAFVNCISLEKVYFFN